VWGTQFNTENVIGATNTVGGGVFTIDRPIEVIGLRFEVTTAASAGATASIGLVSATVGESPATSWPTVFAPLIRCRVLVRADSIAVDSTGNKLVNFNSPLMVPPGDYATIYNGTATASLRALGSLPAGFAFRYDSTESMNTFSTSLTASQTPPFPSEFTISPVGAFNTCYMYVVFLRWRYAQ
jgi:hypothetical protein